MEEMSFLGVDSTSQPRLNPCQSDSLVNSNLVVFGLWVIEILWLTIWIKRANKF